MRRSKEIFTFLLFLLIAFVIWWVNAAYQLSDGVSGEPSAVGEQSQSEPLVTEKRLSLPVEAVGVPAGQTLHLFPSTADVYVRVRVEDYEELTMEDFRVWCSYPMTQTDVLILHVDVSDSKAMSVRIDPEEAEYLIEEN